MLYSDGGTRRCWRARKRESPEKANHGRKTSPNGMDAATGRKE